MCGGAVNEETINHWYTLLQEIIDKYEIEPNLIFAMDETCCFLDKCTHKTWHIGSHGVWQQLALWNENCETATLIPIICADCNKITVLIRRWHFQCGVKSSDQFPIVGEFLNGIEASLNTVRSGRSDVWLMGLSGLIVMLLFPLKHPICLSRPKHALTRYNSRCNLRLGYFHPSWLTLQWLVVGS